MAEAADRVEDIGTGVRIVGQTAYLCDDILTNDMILQLGTNPYDTASINRNQDVTYRSAPDIKIRLTISIFITMISCCSVVLGEIVLPFGCMAQPMRRGGFSRIVEEKSTNADVVAQNLVTQIQVPIVGCAFVYIIMRKQNCNFNSLFVVLCAMASWLGSCCNSIVWSPSYWNCRFRSTGRTLTYPHSDDLGPGTLVQTLSNICFILFAIWRLLLLHKYVPAFRGYDALVKAMATLSLTAGVGAISVQQSFGSELAGILYFAASFFILCTLALVLILFSIAQRKLRCADFSVVNPAMDGRDRASSNLKRERCCISLTLMTSCASAFFTGLWYLSSGPFASKFDRFKYVAYSVDTMVSIYCVANLMSSSEERVLDYERIQRVSS